MILKHLYLYVYHSYTRLTFYYFIVYYCKDNLSRTTHVCDISGLLTFI